LPFIVFSKWSEAYMPPNPGHSESLLSRENYRIGVPQAGRYREIINPDSVYYAGSNKGNGDHPLESEPLPWMNQSHSLALMLPPMASLVLQPE
jgi:1,4-alpha-glucan branching enzyme